MAAHQSDHGKGVCKEIQWDLSGGKGKRGTIHLDAFNCVRN